MSYTFKLLKCTYRDKLRFSILSTLVVFLFYIVINLFNNFKAVNFKSICIVIVNSFIFSALFSIATSQYKDFKISIQLGFARSTLWKSRLVELALQSIILITYILSVIKVQGIYCSIMKMTGLFFSVFCVTWAVLSTLLALASLLALYKIIGKLLVAVGLYFFVTIIIKLQTQFNAITLFVFNKIFNSNFYAEFFSISIIWTLLMLLVSYIFTLRTQIRRS